MIRRLERAAWELAAFAVIMFFELAYLATQAAASIGGRAREVRVLRRRDREP